MNEDSTTLVCLFHEEDHAHAAMQDQLKAGIPQSAISLIDKSQSKAGGYVGRSLEELGVPERDNRHLVDGIKAGGMVIAVSAIQDHVDAVERVFEKHHAGKIDEAVTRQTAPVPVAAPVAAAAVGERVIPIVEEELTVGKRAVDRGGVRVYRRIVETPVEESVNLREEHVTVDRVPVNRAVSGSELTMQGDRTIELTETAEEAVVGKTARVVEEVRVGKEMSEHAEQIHDSVRKTEVEVEEVAAGAGLNRAASIPAAATTTAANSERDVTRGGL